MPSTPFHSRLSPRKRQMLADMGIQVWYPRLTGQPDAQPAASSPSRTSESRRDEVDLTAEADIAASEGVKARRELSRLMQSDPGAEAVAPQGQADDAMALSAQDSAEAGLQTAMPEASQPLGSVSESLVPPIKFFVAKLVRPLPEQPGRVLLLLSVDAFAAPLKKFVSDVLVAAASLQPGLPGHQGNQSDHGASAKAVQFSEFQWPVLSPQGTPAKALGAFWQKHEVHTPGSLLLVDKALQQQLQLWQPLPEKTCTIPELASLFSNAAAKRELWAAIVAAFER